VCWGSDYWFGIVCGGAVMPFFVLGVMGQCLLLWYCVCYSSDSWFVIACGGAVITGLLFVCCVSDSFFGIVCCVAVFWLVLCVLGQ